jgi:hypothetical protein
VLLAVNEHAGFFGLNLPRETQERILMPFLEVGDFALHRSSREGMFKFKLHYIRHNAFQRMA